MEIYRFLFVTCPLGWCVTWLCRRGPLIPSQHPAKFGVHRPCESEDITFFICHMTTKFGVHKSCESGDIPVFICHVTTISKGHVTFRVGPLILSDHPAKFGDHRPYGTRNDGVCNISSNSNSIFNSNSNADVPMPRFSNGQENWCLHQLLYYSHAIHAINDISSNLDNDICESWQLM